MNNLQKYILRLFQPKMAKKIENILTDKVLYYDILKKGIGLILNQKEIQGVLKEMKKMGIEINRLDDKLAVYIVNNLRKKDVFNELSGFVLKQIDDKLK